MKRVILLIAVIVVSINIPAVASQNIQIKGPAGADRVVVHSLDANKAVVSVLDANENPITGLKEKDFTISELDRAGKVLSVSPLETVEEIPLHIVLVTDNSLSMQNRNAVKPLLNALEEFYKALRPVDDVHAIVFDDEKTIPVKGYAVHAKTFQSNNIDELRSFMNESFSDGITQKTYLYDSMMAGLEMIRQMPEESNKYLLVFTDGEDNRSKVKYTKLEEITGDIRNFSAYAVDFKEGISPDFFLQSFSRSNNGRIWKAESSDELVPILQSFSQNLRHQYIISYQFLNPPTGTVALEPKTVVIEEVTTTDSAPLLNYVFFEEGQSAIPDDYILYSSSDMTGVFSEQQLGNPMDKYRHVLNVLGKRLMDNPGTRITIVGCNSDQGPETNNRALSRKRAEAVALYFQTIWGVDPSRMEVAERNLPETPSARTTKAGIAENQRVEIRTADTSLLDMITSTYVQNVANAEELRIKPQIQSEAGIANWTVELKGSDQTVIDSASGQGDLGSAVTFNLIPAGLSRIASFKTLTASVNVTDREGLAFRDENAAITNVQFIRKQVQSAKREGQRMLETYSLILFEYDKADIREHNQAIIDRIVARIKEKPDADVRIVGRTDSIGSENYNLRLSKRRARAVYDQMMAAGLAGRKNLIYTGIGPLRPLYDNATPEGRALNRTVVVTLEYKEKS